MKKILIGLVVIIVIVGVGIGYIWSNLDEIVRSQIEKIGSEATQTEVALSSVNLDLTGGKAELNGLTVGNPGGFNTPSAFSLGGIAVVLDPKNVSGELVQITSIAIDAPKITYEINAGGANIDAIQKNVDAYAKKGSSGGGGSAGGSSSSSEGPKFIVDKLTITGASVSVVADFIKSKEVNSTLGPITLTNIGKGSGGVTSAQLATQVISALTKSTTSAVGDMGLEDMAKGAMDSIKKDPKGAGEKIKNLFGN